MHQPILYLMFGYPGAGKTTASKIIHEITGAIHLSSDQTRFEMFPSPAFSQKEHDMLYHNLDKETELLLQQGKNVIYDANLNRLQHRQDKYEICQRIGAKPVLIWIKTPRDEAKQRASHLSRQHLWPPNETSDQLFERIANLIELPTADEKYIEIDGTKLDKENIKKVLLDAKAL